ncbi:MAG: holo-ACP synthase [Bacteroidales bacterium]|nr:holo-ACP synthase [Bacteroidales bacterium]
MIAGTGIDIIEVDRIQKVMERDIGFREKIFTPGEIAYCESKKNKYQHYAARFSAKEAFMKAIGTGWRFGIRFAEIDIVHDDLGRPYIRIYGKANDLLADLQITKIHVSLSHLKELATAIVIIESESISCHG